MILKLMKYDFKRMTAIVKWFYPIAIFLAVVSRLLALIENVQLVTIINGIVQGVFYGVIVNILVNTIIHVIRNVIVYFFKDQSYLTHTLPVSKKELFTSKYLSALLFMLLSVVVIIASLLILYCKTPFGDMIVKTLEVAITNYDMSAGWLVTLFLGVIIFQVLAVTSMGLTAMIMGYYHNRKKPLMSILYFLLFDGILNTLLLVLMVLFAAITGDLTGLFANQMPQRVFIAIMVLALVINIACSIFFFFFGEKKFLRGVNVD